MFRGVLADAINNGEGRDDDFARGKRADDADADLPVVTQRLEHRLRAVPIRARGGILQRELCGQAVGRAECRGFPGVAGFSSCAACAVSATAAGGGADLG
jgi:hypothetical protein